MLNNLRSMEFKSSSFTLFIPCFQLRYRKHYFKQEINQSFNKFLLMSSLTAFFYFLLFSFGEIRRKHGKIPLSNNQYGINHFNSKSDNRLRKCTLCDTYHW